MKVVRRWLVAALSLAVTASLVPVAQARPSAPSASPHLPTAAAAPASLPGVVLVTMKGDPTADKLTRVYGSAETSAGAVRVLHHNLLMWKVPHGQSREGFIGRLKGSGEIVLAEPDYLRTPTAYTPPVYSPPNDPSFSNTDSWYLDGAWYYDAESWWLNAINMPMAWEMGYSGSAGPYHLRAPGTSFKVAVIDTGFYMDHPDKGNIIAGRDMWDSYTPSGGYTVADPTNVTPPDPTYVDNATGPTYDDKVAEVSHGTAVAGEIGAAVNNAAGVVGVGYDPQVAIYKVMGVDRSGKTPTVGIPDDRVAAAIEQAADDGAKVINMSLGGPDPSATLQTAVDYAWNKGAVVVAAAGNSAGDTGYNGGIDYPAACNHVVAVGATELSGSSQVRAFFSNYGTGLDLVAPGVMVDGLTKPGYAGTSGLSISPGYYWWSGTSMASPIAAGTIAWLWRAAPALSNQEIINLVQATAGDISSGTGAVPGYDTYSGYGAIDAAAAYARLEALYPVLGNPLVSVPATTTSTSVHASWSAVPASARGVTFDVTVDGSPRLTGTSATSTVLSVANGAHVLKVTPHSAYNWEDGTASTTVDFAVNPTYLTPTQLLLGSANAHAGDALKLRTSLTDAASAPMPGKQLTLEYSADGSNFATAPVSVSDDGAGEYSASFSATDTGSYRFQYPGDSSHAAARSAPIEIVIAEGSTSFGPASATPLTPYSLQPVTISAVLFDSNNVPLTGRSVVVESSPNGQSPWALTGITAGDTGGGDYQAIIKSVAGPTVYRLNFLGEPGYQPSGSTGVTITPHPGTTNWTGAVADGSGATTVNTAYLGSVTIHATLTDYAGSPMAGAPVVMQSSTDGSTFSDVPGVPVTDLGGGTYRAVAKAGSTTWFRLAFHGVSYDQSSASLPVKLMPAAKIGNPYAKATQRANVAFSTYGSFLPRRTSTARLIRLTITKKSGTKWVTYRYVWTKSTVAATYSRYAVNLRLGRGSYRIYARFLGDSKNRAAAAPGYRSVAVR